jgi:hypothetical protein
MPPLGQRRRADPGGTIGLAIRPLAARQEQEREGRDRGAWHGISDR